MMSSSTATAPVIAQRTLVEAFETTASRHAQQPALRTPDGSVEWTWGEYAAHVRAAAAGLVGLGLRHGDTLACPLDRTEAVRKVSEALRAREPR